MGREEQQDPAAREPAWERARRILHALFASVAPPSANLRVGYARRVGEGLSRDVFGAEVDFIPDAGGWNGMYAVLVPRVDAPGDVDARAEAEARLLARLARLQLPFRTPRLAWVVPDGGRGVLVRSCLGGMPLDRCPRWMKGVCPWEVTAQVAAAIHSTPLGALEEGLPGYPSRRAHAEAELSRLDGIDDPLVAKARAWAREHLPPPDPSRLVHGDLLGQNILLLVDAPPGVIDWEYSVRGDPAWDLAIVTRGSARPFNEVDGFARLLAAYASHGGAPLTAADVRFYEVCLAARWYFEALRGDTAQGDPAPLATRLRAVLRRAAATL